jgi:hypothetical protein
MSIPVLWKVNAETSTRFIFKKCLSKGNDK